ncbi:MAG: hypothetical protein EOM36_10805, partial [Bacteroidia bacterium]|nr:hypothetical protein [Bacteroidia bacterium]
MKLIVYKGFDTAFLEALEVAPLIEGPIESRKNVLLYDSKISKKLDLALLGLEDGDEAWILYEEYSLLKASIENAIDRYGLKLKIFRNNLYPDYYPITFEMGEDLVQEIMNALNDISDTTTSSECQKFIAVYNTLSSIDGMNYGGFYNYEYEQSTKIEIVEFFPKNIRIEESQESCDYNIFLNEDIDTYLRDFTRISETKPQTVGLKSTAGEASNRFQMSLQAYCVHKGIRLLNFHEMLPADKKREDELISIAKEDIGIANFQEFRKIKFYKNP